MPGIRAAPRQDFICSACYTWRPSAPLPLHNSNAAFHFTFAAGRGLNDNAATNHLHLPFSKRRPRTNPHMARGHLSAGCHRADGRWKAFGRRAAISKTAGRNRNCRHFSRGALRNYHHRQRLYHNAYAAHFSPLSSPLTSLRRAWLCYRFLYATLTFYLYLLLRLPPTTLNDACGCAPWQPATYGYHHLHPPHLSPRHLHLIRHSAGADAGRAACAWPSAPNTVCAPAGRRYDAAVYDMASRWNRTRRTGISGGG